MDNQEAFDKAALHLLKQGEKSVRPDGICVYRFGGLRCAVGALIPDSDYASRFEGQPASDVRRQVVALRTVDVLLLNDLQAIHDDVSPLDWAGELRDCAETYGLSTRVIDEFEAQKAQP